MSDADRTRDCYEEILAEHAKLRSLLDAIKAMLFERTAPMSELANRLTELEALVGGHFKTEEESGCFDSLVSQAPRVSDRVDVLIAEHGELSVQIRDLIKQAQASSGTHDQGSPDQWDAISSAFTEFTERLLHHEMVENELMQEVFTEDIGSKD